MEDQKPKGADVGTDATGGKYGTESAAAMSTAKAQPEFGAGQSPADVVQQAQQMGAEAAERGPNKQGQDDQIPKGADVGKDPQGGQYGTESAQAMSAAKS